MFIGQGRTLTGGKGNWRDHPEGGGDPRVPLLEKLVLGPWCFTLMWGNGFNHFFLPSPVAKKKKCQEWGYLARFGVEEEFS